MKLQRSIIKLFGLATCLLPLLLGGCVAFSVYPFYTEKDVSFDPALLGKWTEKPDAEGWQFEKRGTKGYVLTEMSGQRTNFHDAYLFKLKQYTFLDLRSHPSDDNDGVCLPLHHVLRVYQIEPTLKAVPLSMKWVEELVAKEPKAIRHMIYREEVGDTNGTVVLTADTAELQAFLLKYVNNTNAFAGNKKGEVTEFTRRK